MQIDSKLILNVFSPRFFSRAFQSFDKSLMVIVSSCWVGAILVMAFALYTLTFSAETKRATLAAAASEPTLPKLVTRKPDTKEIQPLVTRLEKRFPDITFRIGRDRSITVAARTADYFRTWLTVLSYIDTISPWFRWRIKEFCVGANCSYGNPMTAILTAEKISFSLPEKED
ncbi:MAG: hypothetical protein AB7S81_05575 [Bdellovibrionales bacterium]